MVLIERQWFIILHHHFWLISCWIYLRFEEEKKEIIFSFRRPLFYFFDRSTWSHGEEDEDSRPFYFYRHLSIYYFDFVCSHSPRLKHRFEFGLVRKIVKFFSMAQNDYENFHLSSELSLSLSSDWCTNPPIRSDQWSNVSTKKKNKRYHFFLAESRTRIAFANTEK